MPHGLIYLSMDVCWAFSLVMSLLYYLSLLPYQNHFCAPEYNREICPSTLTNKTITERRTVLWFGCIFVFILGQVPVEPVNKWDSIQPKIQGRGGCLSWGGGQEKRGKDENNVFFCWIRIHFQITHVKVVLLNKMNSILVVCVYQSFVFVFFFLSSNCRISSSTALTSEGWKVINSQAPSKYLNQDSGAEAFGGLYVLF